MKAMTIVIMQDEDVGCRIKISFVARAFIVKDGLGSILKLGLHLHANGMQMGITQADESRGRMYGIFVHCLAFVEAENRRYINVLYANSL